MTAKLKEDGKYALITDLAAFGDIFGERSDSSGISFSVRTANSYGVLKLNISKGEGELMIQLLDLKENIIEEKKLKNQGSIVFPLLERGKYRIRAIYDLNNDGKWTTGDYDKKRQPEPVSFFHDEVEIKINWNIEEDWDIGMRNFKNRNMGTNTVQTK
jgi:hypothetical protein